MRIYSVALAVVIAAAFSGCSSFPLNSLLEAVPKPSIEGVKPRVAGIDFRGVDLVFDVAVANPYTFAIKSPKFLYGIDIQDRPLMASEKTTDIDLPAQDTGTVSLPVRIGYASLWKMYTEMKGANEIPYTLKGTLVLTPMDETIELPLRKSGAFPVLRPPKLNPIEIKPGDVSLRSGTVAIRTALTNPNTFALGLKQMGYAVKLGDIDLAQVSASALSELASGETAEVVLSGKVSGLKAVRQFFSKPDVGALQVLPTGSISTPYGEVRLP